MLLALHLLRVRFCIFFYLFPFFCSISFLLIFALLCFAGKEPIVRGGQGGGERKPLVASA